MNLRGPLTRRQVLVGGCAFLIPPGRLARALAASPPMPPSPSDRLAVIEARLGGRLGWPPGRPPILMASYSIGSTAAPDLRDAALADVARVVADSLR